MALYQAKVVVAAAVLGTILLAAAAPAQQSMAEADIWFASAAREFLGDTIEINGADYELSEVAASPSDITTFDVRARAGTALGPAFEVAGTIQLGPLPAEVETINDRYMLALHAYLVCDGRIVWEQDGYPQGDAWVPSSGAGKRFTLIDAYRGSTSGCTAFVVAAGDPLFAGDFRAPVVLGAKRIQLP